MAFRRRQDPPRQLSVTAYRTWTGTSRNLCVGFMVALILHLISNKNGAVYDGAAALPKGWGLWHCFQG
jgi:hypothetical protein